MIETLLLSTTRVETFAGGELLTTATGFFFERDDELFLVSSRHVFVDEASGHHPDTLNVELHVDGDNLADTVALSCPLFDAGGGAHWRQGMDAGGEIDVAVLRLHRTAIPEAAVIAAFTPAHLPPRMDAVEIGTPLLVPGFPLGFLDTLHRTPVVRAGCVASSFGLRFQGEGYFLTDARTHRGSSGAPVVMRLDAPAPACAELPWQLLGIHSARLDMISREAGVDEALGLNCAWYADILLTLTAPPPAQAGGGSRGGRSGVPGR